MHLKKWFWHPRNMEQPLTKTPGRWHTMSSSYTRYVHIWNKCHITRRSDQDFKQNMTSKMFKLIEASKNILRTKWTLEYPIARCERHNFANGESSSVKVRNIVQIKGEWNNTGEWKTGLISKIFLSIMFCWEQKWEKIDYWNDQFRCCILYRFKM